MSDSAKVSVTLKGGTEFSAPWIVFHADTLAEAVSLLETAGDTNIATLAANAAKSFQAQYAAAGTLGQTQAVSVTTPNAVQPTAPAPTQSNGVPTCAHGAMTYREGTSARGPWTAHFCSTPKGTPNQCAPIFGGK